MTEAEKTMEIEETRADDRKICPIFLAAQVSRFGVGTDNLAETLYCEPECAWYEENRGTCGLLAAIERIGDAISAHLQ